MYVVKTEISFPPLHTICSVQCSPSLSNPTDNDVKASKRVVHYKLL